MEKALGNHPYPTIHIQLYIVCIIGLKVQNKGKLCIVGEESFRECPKHYELSGR